MPRGVGHASLILLLACAATVAQGQAAQPAQQPGQTASTSQGDSKSGFSVLSLKTHTLDEPYEPITEQQRFQWVFSYTLGPLHLLGGGIFSAAVGTALDRPKEYGPGWGGFGDRFGMRLTGISTGNTIEATFGAAWGEDPRYFRVPDGSFGARLGNVVKQTFVARRRDGHFAPAYARYMAIPGNNFMSNLWRADSEANDEDAALRTLEGFGGRMASNAWEEFWPSISSHLFHHGH
jgi:hypothetical protein